MFGEIAVLVAEDNEMTHFLRKSFATIPWFSLIKWFSHSSRVIGHQSSVDHQFDLSFLQRSSSLSSIGNNRKSSAILFIFDHDLGRYGVVVAARWFVNGEVPLGSEVKLAHLQLQSIRISVEFVSVLDERVNKQDYFLSNVIAGIDRMNIGFQFENINTDLRSDELKFRSSFVSFQLQTGDYLAVKNALVQDI